MVKQNSIALIIPCYNEEEGLTTLLRKAPNFLDEVIIVNNNSTDKTVEIAKSFNCTILNETTKGYGAAYKCGFKYVTKDIVVTMDGDDTYPIEEVENNINLLIDNNYDFISCSRFPIKTKGAMNITNLIGNKILTITSFLLFAKPIKDSQSGMWIFRKNIFDKFFPKSDGMALSQEIKLLALNHPEIKFHESFINYKPRIGNVKLNKWKDGFKNLKQLFQMKFQK